MRSVLFVFALLTSCASEPPIIWTQTGREAETKATVGAINTLETGRAANRILREAPEGKEIRINFVTEGKTRLGELVDVPLYALTFDQSDVAAARFENLDPWQTMSLAKSITIKSGMGRSLIIKDCDAFPALCEQASQP